MARFNALGLLSRLPQTKQPGLRRQAFMKKPPVLRVFFGELPKTTDWTDFVNSNDREIPLGQP
jgi:hypothetical protein